MDKIMTVNSGSSSLKFKLFEMPERTVLCSGVCERIGLNDGIFTVKYNGLKEQTFPVFKTHEDAAKAVVEVLLNKGIIKSFDEIKACGHRVVQGGKYFSESVELNDEVVKKIESLIPLAPLHNPAHLVCYKAFKNVLPNAIHVATFDTAFHQTMEEEDYIFPIPYELSEKYDIRRYGAHGTSHKYLAEQASKYLDNKIDSKVISCHIGSGASITAIKNGKCVATSMGLTPLGGIMMGTRCGDIDPSVFNYLVTVTGKTPEEVYQMLNKQSGFLGVGGSSDSRDIFAGIEKGDKKCELANKLFVRRIADFIGQYFVRLGGCDLIIFSAGIGENAPEIRSAIIKEIYPALGTVIDEKLNDTIHGSEALISTKDSKIKVAIIPTDEEVMIALDAYNIYKR